MTVLIGMFLLGLLIALGTWVALVVSDHVEAPARGQGVLLRRVSEAPTARPDQPATAQQIDAMRRRIESKPLVATGGVEFVSKAEALKVMQARAARPRRQTSSRTRCPPRSGSRRGAART